MSKYRIIKAIAKDEDRPYFVQEWDATISSWLPYFTSGYKSLKEAKSRIQSIHNFEQRKNTPAEVVWEEEDEPR